LLKICVRKLPTCVAMARVLIAAALGLSSTVQADDSGIVELDMYRAMTATDVGKLSTQNDDTADLTGVIKYIQTEVIVDNTLSPTHTTRKYNIDVIAQWRWQVKNSDDLLQDPAYAHFVDFGPFQAFDFGQSTNPALDEVIEEHGDIVGAQPQVDARYPTIYPYYWLSVSGLCPNLPWACTKGYVDPVTHEACQGHATTHRCEDTPCPGKGTAAKPNENCLKYDGTEKAAMGGLCPNYLDPDFKGPTGELGCVYSYSKDAVKLMLDDLVGITQMDCGGHNCKDWQEFRSSCTDQDLKRGIVNGQVQKVSHCVEYDIHPACLNRCDDPKCLAVPEDQREVGIPFWLGRCNATRNNVRAEMTAAAFGIKNAQTGHNLVADEVIQKAQPCVVDARPGTCSPDAKSGGPFCTRRYSGVCTTCYVPGTTMPYPANATQPSCPMDILHGKDYGQGSAFSKPECASAKPRDLCCLYSGSCEGETDPSKVGFDDDGLAVVTAQANYDGSSQPLIDYFTRIAQDADFGKYPKDANKLQDFAYGCWSLEPSFKPVDSKSLKPQLKDMFTDVPPPTPAPTPPAPAPGGGGSNNGIIIAAIVVLVLIAGGVGVFYMRRKQAHARQREVLLTGTSQA